MIDTQITDWPNKSGIRIPGSNAFITVAYRWGSWGSWEFASVVVLLFAYQSADPDPERGFRGL